MLGEIFAEEILTGNNNLMFDDHLFSKYAKFSTKTHTYVCVSGGKKC